MCAAVAHALQRMLCSAVCSAQQACSYCISPAMATDHSTVHASTPRWMIPGSMDPGIPTPSVFFISWSGCIMRCHPRHALHSTTCSMLYAAVQQWHTTLHTCTSIPSWRSPILGSSMPVPIPCTTPDPRILDARSWCVHSPAACMHHNMALQCPLEGPRARSCVLQLHAHHPLLLTWYPVSGHVDPHGIRYLGISISMVWRFLVSTISMRSWMYVISEVRHCRGPWWALNSHLLTPRSPTSLCSTAA